MRMFREREVIFPAYHIRKVVLDDPQMISHAPCYFHWSVNQSYFQVLTFTIGGSALVNPSLLRPPEDASHHYLLAAFSSHIEEQA